MPTLSVQLLKVRKEPLLAANVLQTAAIALRC